MSSTILPFGIEYDWQFGETPYDVGFLKNLEILSDSPHPLVIDYRRVPQSDPDFRLPGENPPYSKINPSTGIIEYWAYNFEGDPPTWAWRITRTIEPWVGMIVAVRADAAFAIYTATGWRHLFNFTSGGAMEVSIDCDFPRPKKPVASLGIHKSMVLGAGQRKSQMRPQRNRTPDLMTIFRLLRNDVQFGTISVPGFNSSITSPTFAINATRFDVGDILTIMAPDSIHGITGLSFTLRFYGDL